MIFDRGFGAVFEPDFDNMVTGLWCQDCQLPSVVSTPLVMLSDTGLCPAGDVVACVHCDNLADGEEDDDGDDTGVLARR